MIFENLFIEYPKLECIKNDIISAYNLLVECYKNKNKTLICGNGGSASDSEHIVGELMKGFNLNRFTKIAGLELELKNIQGALRSISLVSQTSLITAITNDIGADMIFAQQVYGYLDKGDILICLSTSGNAKNVINAAKVAKAIGGKVIAFTGKNGGQIKDYADITIKLPADKTYQVQELTLPVYHAICAMLEEEFFS